MTAASPMDAGLPRRQGPWRTAWVGALVGLVVMLALTMAWLAGHQVEAAQQRRAFEAALREADARCFDLATRRETDLCRAANAMRGNPATK